MDKAEQHVRSAELRRLCESNSSPTLSLIDRFAMAAMQGWLASGEFNVGCDVSDMDNMASQCYLMAESMLRERAGLGENGDNPPEMPDSKMS